MCMLHSIKANISHAIPLKIWRCNLTKMNPKRNHMWNIWYHISEKTWLKEITTDETFNVILYIHYTTFSFIPTSSEFGGLQKITISIYETYFHVIFHCKVLIIVINLFKACLDLQRNACGSFLLNRKIHGSWREISWVYYIKTTKKSKEFDIWVRFLCLLILSKPKHSIAFHCQQIGLQSSKSS